MVRGKPLETVMGQCCDCKPGTRRRVAKPGPRCREHRLARRRELRARKSASHVEKHYSITEDEYQAILKTQGGVCYGCDRAPGVRRLAVDHDHSCCPGRISCGLCVRGLLCKKCNFDVLGHLGDSPDRLRRLADYVETNPAQEVLARVRGL